MAYQEQYDVYTKIQENFKGICLEPITIGQSYENRDIKVFPLTLIKQNYEQQNGVYINGLQHAREPISTTMVFYLFVKYIYLYKRQDQDMINLLSTNVLWFQPMINVDTYEFNYQHFLQTQQFSLMRKSRRPTGCKDQLTGRYAGNGNGVDINRNYPYKFGIDNQGSSDNKCQEDYRGEYPFSEPETQAIKNFLDKRPNIKVAFNFHAYGPLWIVPYNYYNDVNNSDIQPNTTVYNVYNNYKQQKNLFPLKGKYFQFGNAKQTIDYIANGEFTDWQLHEYGIYGVTVELGANSTAANTYQFYPKKSQILIPLQDCYPAINYFIQQSTFLPKIEYSQFLQTQDKINFLKDLKIVKKDKYQQYQVLTVEIFNSGLADIQENDLNKLHLGIQMMTYDKQFINQQDAKDNIKKNIDNEVIQDIYIENYTEDQFLSLQQPEINDSLLKYNRQINYTQIQQENFKYNTILNQSELEFILDMKQGFKARTYKKLYIVLQNYQIKDHQLLNISVDFKTNLHQNTKINFKQNQLVKLLNTEQLEKLNRQEIVGEIPAIQIQKIYYPIFIIVIIICVAFFIFIKYKEVNNLQSKLSQIKQKDLKKQQEQQEYEQVQDIELKQSKIDSDRSDDL